MSTLRTCLFLSLAALCLAASPAQAQTGYYNADDQPAAADDDGPDAAPPSAHNVVVTSLEKCYAQLGHAEALDIERNFTKPYEECQRRLALKLQAQQQLRAGQLQKIPAPVPTAPPAKDAAGGTDIMNPPPQPQAAPAAPADEGLYYRVQKDPLPPGSVSQ